MSIDRLIIGSTVRRLQRCPTDVTACPSPDVSLIAEADWDAMVLNAGSEDALLLALGVTYADGE
jgi:hypothetical protein